MTERVKGAALSYVFVAVKIVATIVYIPLLLSALGKSEYGLYQFVGSLFSYITIFEGCLSTGVLRYYCQAKTNNDVVLMEKTLATARRIYRMMSLFMIPLGIICITAFRLIYASSFSESEINEGSIILVILFANFIVTLLNSIYVTSINANEKFVFAKSCMIVSQILQPVLSLLILNLHPKAIVVALVQMIVNSAIAVLNYLYSVNKLNIRVKIRIHDSTYFREILFFSSTLLLAAVADQLFWKVDQLVLGKLYNTGVVAIYAIGSQVYMIYMDVGTQIASVFFPKISRLYVEEDAVKKLSDLFTMVGRIASMIVLLILSGFCIFGKEFILKWVGEGFDESYYVAIIIMIPFTVDIIQNIGLTILKVTNQYGFRAKMYFAAAVVNVGLTIIMAKYYGIIGAACATAISMTITSGIIMNLYYSKAVGLDMRSFWSNIVSVILRIMPVFIIGYLLNSLVQTKTIIALLIKIIIYSSVYVVVTMLWIMNRDEKEMVSSVLRRIHKRKDG